MHQFIVDLEQQWSSNEAEIVALEWRAEMYPVSGIAVGRDTAYGRQG